MKEVDVESYMSQPTTSKPIEFLPPEPTQNKFDITQQALDAAVRVDDFSTISQRLLNEHLLEDEALTEVKYMGNAVEVLLRDSDSDSWLLNAEGEHLDTVAVRSLGAGRSPRPLVTCALPNNHRVLQLALSQCGMDDSCTTGHRLLAIRSTHWLHHMCIIGDGSGSAPDAGSSSDSAGGAGLRLCNVASAILPRRPLHVALNPAMEVEATCLLDDGRLQVLRLERAARFPIRGTGTSGSFSSAFFASAAGTEAHAAPFVGTTSADPMRGVDLKIGRHSQAGPHASTLALRAEDPWGSVEYSDHPRTVYLANGSGLYSADLRQAAQPSLLFDVRGLPLPELRSGALAVPAGARQRHGAAASAPVVAISSSEQLLLFDARHLRCPLRQWRLPGMAQPEQPEGQHDEKEKERELPHSMFNRHEPLPHYMLDFSDDGQFLHLVERNTAQPLLVAWDDREDQPNGGSPFVKTRFQNPINRLDTAFLASQHARLKETLTQDGGLPLIGAVVLPLISRVHGVKKPNAIVTLNAFGKLNIVAEADLTDDEAEESESGVSDDEDEESESGVSDDEDAATFVRGQSVRLHSLQARADLNGSIGRITANAPDSNGRWAVRLPATGGATSSKTKLLREENLESVSDHEASGGTSGTVPTAPSGSQTDDGGGSGGGGGGGARAGGGKQREQVVELQEGIGEEDVVMLEEEEEEELRLALEMSRAEAEEQEQQKRQKHWPSQSAAGSAASGSGRAAASGSGNAAASGSGRASSEAIDVDVEDAEDQAMADAMPRPPAAPGVAAAPQRSKPALYRDYDGEDRETPPDKQAAARRHAVLNEYCKITKIDLARAMAQLEPPGPSMEPHKQPSSFKMDQDQKVEGVPIADMEGFDPEVMRSIMEPLQKQWDDWMKKNFGSPKAEGEGQDSHDSDED